MLPCFAPANSVARQVQVVTVAGFADWLRSAEPRTRRWLDTTAFKAKAGAVALLPDGEGELALALLVTGDPATPWDAAALQAALLMDAAGKDDVFLETVGVGQAEVDVIDHADSVVLVLIPGSGDSIQALKAGVMEIPDVIVVNKADHPLTDTMVREIRGVLSLAPQGDWPVPIVKTEAHRGEGVELLQEKLAEHRAFVESEGLLAERRRRNLMNEVLGLATVRLRRALEASLHEDPEVQQLLDESIEIENAVVEAAEALKVGQIENDRIREEIIRDVWDEHWWGPTKTLDVHISGLRKKLGPEPWITTLRGVGYRLDPPGSPEPPAADGT